MADIQLAPAPWKLKGRSWSFFVTALSSKSSFPAGWCSAYEAEALSTGGEFIGGLGVVQASSRFQLSVESTHSSILQIISYSESPVGPYDELVYVPGRWKYADEKTAFRITQIYVSSKESTLNGRKNWNIPKRIANFSIKPGSSSGATDISVSLPGASAPFFKASIKPITILSSLSVRASTSLLGSYFGLMQPPLPAGPEPEEIATTQWAALLPVLKGSASFRKLVPELDGKIGDGKGFPAVVPWSVGFTMENLDMDFGVSTTYDTV
ncbi:hypothetical protein MVEN_00785200 [Mycena venus]|uniref:Uncharacterized protein n=1 Tax=Mycena venus TaxID=2733690 RepID=A0A8H6YKV1_9AGAR|nr:hypothetical protein MVEN_00785200 [Mycena venus]